MPIVRASRLDREPLISESQDALGRDFAFFRRKIYFLSKEKDVFFEGKRGFPPRRWAWRPFVGAPLKGRFSILAYEPVDCWIFFSFSRANCPVARKNRFSRTLGCKVSKWKSRDIYYYVRAYIYYIVNLGAWKGRLCLLPMAWIRNTLTWLV